MLDFSTESSPEREPLFNMGNLIGKSCHRIVHFERMSLDGLYSNSVILTKEQAVRAREGNSLLVYAYHHTLAHSLFFLSDSFFVSKFPVFSLSFTPFFSCFSLVLSLVFSFPLLLFSYVCLYCAQLRPFLYCLPLIAFVLV